MCITKNNCGQVVNCSSERLSTHRVRDTMPKLRIYSKCDERIVRDQCNRKRCDEQLTEGNGQTAAPASVGLPAREAKQARQVSEYVGARRGDRLGGFRNSAV
jgi:hypothetical protein